MEILGGVGKFLLICFGSTGIGIAVAMLLSLLFRRTNIRNNPSIEIIFLVMFAYISSMISDSLHLSVIFTTVLLGSATRPVLKYLDIPEEEEAENDLETNDRQGPDKWWHDIDTNYIIPFISYPRNVHRLVPLNEVNDILDERQMSQNFQELLSRVRGDKNFRYQVIQEIPPDNNQNDVVMEGDANSFLLSNGHDEVKLDKKQEN